MSLLNISLISPSDHLIVTALLCHVIWIVGIYYRIGFEYLTIEAVSIRLTIYITRSRSLLRKKKKHGKGDVASSKKNRYGVPAFRNPLNPLSCLAITDLFVRKVTFFFCGKLYCV